MEATGWHLIRIESPEGDMINLEYQYGYVSWFPITKQTTISTTATYPYLGDVYNTRSFRGTYPSDDAIQNKTEGYSLYGLKLYRISSPTNPTVVQFNIFSYTMPLFYNGLTPNSYHQDYKLDNIVLMRDFEVYRKFDLSYDFSEVLQLNSVTESGVSSGGTSVSLPPYKFLYLPKNDVTAPYVLNKIVYPTGGYSSFKFEHNQYSYTSQFEPTPIFPVSNGVDNVFPYNLIRDNNITSWPTDETVGFRIKEQIAKSSENDDLEVIRYYYKYENSTAKVNPGSGVLSKPMFPSTSTFSGTLRGKNGDNFGNYTMTLPTDLYPRLNSLTSVDNGSYTVIGERGNLSVQESNGVGYSSVWVVRSIENDSGASSSKGIEHYQFVNYAEYRINEFSPNHLTLVWVNRNEVGKLIKYERYDSRNNIEYSIHNQYGRGPVVKAGLFFLMNVPLVDPQGNAVVTVEVFKYNLNFYKYNLLRKIESDKSLETYTEYSYDPVTNYLREAKLMEHKINYSTIPDLTAEIDFPNFSNTTYSYKYYSDFYDIGNDSVPYYDYKQVVKNAPVETIVRKDGQVIGAQFTKYTMFRSPTYFNILRPAQIYSLDISAPVTNYVSPNFQWQVQDPRMKLKMTFDKYDRNNGNLLQFHTEGSPPTSMVYDSNYSSILMEAQNCTYEQLNQGIDTNDILAVKWLRTQLPNALITSYTYDFIFGRTSVTAPNGATNYIEYDAFGRVKAIRDNNHNLLQVREYNYNVQ